MVSTNTPPSGIAAICCASCTVCGPAFQAWRTLSWFWASPSTWLQLEIHAGRDHQPVVLEYPSPIAHALLVGLDGGGALVDDPHPVLAQAVVADGERCRSCAARLRTRLLNGHEMNSRFGSTRITSTLGSSRRTYFAAVAPPQPPPITTTRGPVLGSEVALHGRGAPGKARRTRAHPGRVPRHAGTLCDVTLLMVCPPPPGLGNSSFSTGSDENLQIGPRQCQGNYARIASFIRARMSAGAPSR